MKYLYLIIRRLFPKQKWEIIETIKVYDTDIFGKPCGIPIGHRFIMQEKYSGKIKTINDYE